MLKVNVTRLNMENNVGEMTTDGKAEGYDSFDNIFTCIIADYSINLTNDRLVSIFQFSS